MTRIDVAWVDIPESGPGQLPLCGATNSVDKLWLDPDLLYEERRSTLKCDLEHIECGHNGCQDSKTEASVRRVVARRLIDWDDLVDAIAWALTSEEVAAELAVSVDVLRDRVNHIHPPEQMLLAASAQSGRVAP